MRVGSNAAVFRCGMPIAEVGPVAETMRPIFTCAVAVATGRMQNAAMRASLPSTVLLPRSRKRKEPNAKLKRAGGQGAARPCGAQVGFLSGTLLGCIVGGAVVWYFPIAGIWQTVTVLAAAIMGALFGVAWNERSARMPGMTPTEITARRTPVPGRTSFSRADCAPRDFRR